MLLLREYIPPANSLTYGIDTAFLKNSSYIHTFIPYLTSLTQWWVILNMAFSPPCGGTRRSDLMFPLFLSPPLCIVHHETTVRLWCWFQVLGEVRRLEQPEPPQGGGADLTRTHLFDICIPPGLRPFAMCPTERRCVRGVRALVWMPMPEKEKLVDLGYWFIL